MVGPWQRWRKRPATPQVSREQHRRKKSGLGVGLVTTRPREVQTWDSLTASSFAQEKAWGTAGEQRKAPRYAQAGQPTSGEKGRDSV